MKIGLVSLGCPKNLVDSEVMLGLAAGAGHEITNAAREADVIVVNTCGFIESARQESIDTILEMARLKQAGRCRRLVVTGCLAERYRDELAAEIPEIDVVLGTGEVPAIVSAIDDGPTQAGAVQLLHRAADGSTRPLSARHRSAAGRPLPTYLYDAATPRIRTTPSHLAYVKVAEGCDYHCAFCIIPTLRGRYRSRSIASIVDEARRLAAGGVRELLLISQDTTFFGIDRGERDALGRLLRALDKVEDLTWIRLLYLYPTTLTAGTIDVLADCRKVVPYVDLPLQHASAGVLARMRRPGNRRSYTRLLDNLRARIPDVTLRTTFIVGFPGETEDDFAELRRFVREIEFDHVGVFTYSHEDGTAAGRLVDDVDPATKRRRASDLMGEQRAIVERRHRGRVGSHVALMLDGPSPDHPLVWQGRLPGQAPEIDPAVFLTECDVSVLRAGEVLNAEIVEARGYDLVARPLPGSSAP